MAQGFQRHLFLCRQGMLCGQNGHQLVLLQGDDLQLLRRRQHGERAVHPSFHDPFFHFLVIPQQQLVVDVGKIPLKSADDVGHPVGGGRGDGANADKSPLQAPHLVHLHLQPLPFTAQVLGIGQQQRPLGGEPHAGAAALQQGQPPLLLQVGNHAGDARLGIVEHLRRLGKAAVLHRLDKSHVFQEIHIHILPPLSMQNCDVNHENHSLYKWFAS